jgi:hypothetical protein
MTRGDEKKRKEVQVQPRKKEGAAAEKKGRRRPEKKMPEHFARRCPREEGVGAFAS